MAGDADRGALAGAADQAAAIRSECRTGLSRCSVAAATGGGAARSCGGGGGRRSPAARRRRLVVGRQHRLARVAGDVECFLPGGRGKATQGLFTDLQHRRLGAAHDARPGLAVLVGLGDAFDIGYAAPGQQRATQRAGLAAFLGGVERDRKARRHLAQRERQRHVAGARRCRGPTGVARPSVGLGARSV